MTVNLLYNEILLEYLDQVCGCLINQFKEEINKLYEDVCRYRDTTVFRLMQVVHNLAICVVKRSQT